MLGIPGKPDDGKVTVTLDYTVDGVAHCHEFPLTIEEWLNDAVSLDVETPVSLAGEWPLARLRHTGEVIVDLRVRGHAKDKPAFTVTSRAPVSPS